MAAPAVPVDLSELEVCAFSSVVSTNKTTDSKYLDVNCVFTENRPPITFVFALVDADDKPKAQIHSSNTKTKGSKKYFCSVDAYRNPSGKLVGVALVGIIS